MESNLRRNSPFLAAVLVSYHYQTNEGEWTVTGPEIRKYANNSVRPDVPEVSNDKVGYFNRLVSKKVPRHIDEILWFVAQHANFNKRCGSSYFLLAAVGAGSKSFLLVLPKSYRTPYRRRHIREELPRCFWRVKVSGWGCNFSSEIWSLNQCL